MPVNVRELPPAYQVQALRKLAEQERKHDCLPKLPPDPKPTKENKYHNKPTERMTTAGNVLRFPSEKEARRYDYLLGLETQGVIKNLRLQVNFTLMEAYTDSQGRRIQAIRYVADFTYHQRTGAGDSTDTWELVVEDVKSCATRTETYKIKRKMMKEQFGITIQEV